MSLSTITVNGQSVTLVAMPSTPGLKMAEFKARDSVALDVSPFTGQSQAMQWLGADLLSGTMTLPALTLDQARQWKSFLMQVRGAGCAFQLGDPAQPAGITGSGAGTPVVNNTLAGSNAAGSQTLGTSGWTANAAGVLLQGDIVQVDYRMYYALDDVNADSSGDAIVPIWPSLREVPTSGGSLILDDVKGIFRLAANERGWSFELGSLSRMSFQVQEWR